MAPSQAHRDTHRPHVFHQIFSGYFDDVSEADEPLLVDDPVEDDDWLDAGHVEIPHED